MQCGVGERAGSPEEAPAEACEEEVTVNCRAGPGAQVVRCGERPDPGEPGKSPGQQGATVLSRRALRSYLL